MKKVLFEAVIESNDQIVRDCLGKNVNPNVLNDEGESPLHIAAQKGDMAVGQLG